MRTVAKVWDVHEGRPSWHQQRAGHISAAVTSGFRTREDAQAYQAGLREHHPEIPTFILARIVASESEE